MLVSATGTKIGSSVSNWERIEVDADGTGSATIGGFDGNTPVFLVVSPETQETTAHDYSWSAELLTDSDVDDGCSCAASPGRLSPYLVALTIVLGLRRRTSSSGVLAKPARP